MTTDKPNLQADFAHAPLVVAGHWLDECVRARLKDLEVTPVVLERALGGSQSSWRNKLNGTRSFQISDLLGMTLAVDEHLVQHLPLTGEDATEFFPPEYADHLSHTRLGRSLPTFRTGASPWDQASSALATWLAAEEAAGRGWMIDSNVLAYQVLVQAATSGVASTGATRAEQTGSYFDFDWLEHDTHMRVAASERSTRNTDAIRDAHLRHLEHLRHLSAQPQANKALVHLMTPTALTSLTGLLRLPPAEPGAYAWHVVSLQEIHRLDPRTTHPEPIADIHVRLQNVDQRSGLVWLWVK